MENVIETILDNFSFGMTTESRSKDKRYSTLIRHFDILTSQDKAIPHVQMEADTFNSNLSGTAATEKLARFLAYGTTQALSKQYALGVNQGTSNARIFVRDAIPHDQWSGLSAATTAHNEKCFSLYVKTGKFYTILANRYVGSYSISGNSWNETEYDATAVTNTADGLTHSKDDIHYLPVDNKVLKNDNGSWTVGLTLPTGSIITSIFEHGDYLGITVKPQFLGGKAYIYLWDRDSTLNTVPVKIDWGTENLELAESLNGYILGVSVIANSSISFSGSGKVLFKVWGGGSEPDELLTLVASDRVISIGPKQKENNRMYFMMSVELNNTRHEGVWSIGKSKQGMYALALEYLINNDTAITSVGLKGFLLLGDFLTAAFTDNGTYKLMVTDDGEGYANATSVIETLIFNGGDASLKRKLRGVSLMHEALPTNGVAALKYKKDAETSFTAILSNSTDNSISKSAVKTSGGAILPTGYKEMSFRIESTGGAVITGMSFQEVITVGRSYQAIWQAIKSIF